MNKNFCQDCERTFKNQAALRKHQNRKKTSCKQYKYVKHCCLRCGFTVKGLLNMDDHLIKCKLLAITKPSRFELASFTGRRNPAELASSVRSSCPLVRQRSWLEPRTPASLAEPLRGDRGVPTTLERMKTTLSESKSMQSSTSTITHDKYPNTTKQTTNNLKMLNQTKKIERLNITISILSSLIQSLDPKLESFKIEDDNISLFGLTSKSKVFLKNKISQESIIDKQDDSSVLQIPSEARRPAPLVPLERRAITSGQDERTELGSRASPVSSPTGLLPAPRAKLGSLVNFSSKYCDPYANYKLFVKLVKESSINNRINAGLKLALERRKQCGRISQLKILNDLSNDSLQLLIQEKDVEEEETIKKLKNLCVENITQLVSSRKYRKFLLNLQKIRVKLFFLLGITEFVKFLALHIEKLEKVLKEKNKSDKARKGYICDSLSALESRLIGYPGFIFKQLEGGDLNFDCMEKLLRFRTEFNTNFIPFEDCSNIANYSLAMFPVLKLIKYNLINPFGFYNIIYIKKDSELDEDLYSFYKLDGIRGNIRYWRMDCRLVALTNDLIESLRIYCARLFKKLYNIVFGNNKFIENHEKKLAGIKLDCDQLARNFILLSQKRKFNYKIRNLFKLHSTFQPTSHDYFNIYEGDACQRDELQSEKIDEKYILMDLFDEGLTNEYAKKYFVERDI